MSSKASPNSQLTISIIYQYQSSSQTFLHQLFLFERIKVSQLHQLHLKPKVNLSNLTLLGALALPSSHLTMPFQNTYTGFFYRQIFVTPSLITPSTRSLVGSTGIVTGSNTGLGYHASAQLLSLGLSHLILAVRDSSKGEAARTSLLASFKSSGASKQQPIIEVWPLDLTSYSSITAFSQRIRDTPQLRVDFAILNAGVARFNFEQSNGNELTVQTNWLGTALCAILLRPILQSQYTKAVATNAKVSPPVLSIVGSEVAQWAAFKERKIAAQKSQSVLSVLNDKGTSNMGDRYYTSKLLLTLFFRHFCAHLPAGNQVIVNMVNPGFCYGSELHRTLGGAPGKVFGGMKRAIGRSTPIGARTLVHAAAVAGPETHGKYLSDEKVAPFADSVMTKDGEALARQMWREMATDMATAVDVDAVMQQEQ